VHGVSRPDAAIFMLQIAKTERPVFFDGRALRWHDMAVLAPGSHFTFASHAPARWIAFSVANELIEDLLSVLKVARPVLHRNLAVLSRRSAQEFAEAVTKARSLFEKGELDRAPAQSSKHCSKALGQYSPIEIQRCLSPIFRTSPSRKE
jgi:hypothetical protein